MPRRIYWSNLRALLSRPPVIAAAANEHERVTSFLAQMTPGEVWASLVVQIAVVGGAAAGYRLLHSGAIAEIMPEVLLRLDNDVARAGLVHDVLRRSGVRFVGSRRPATKARAIAALLYHPKVIQDGACVFRDTVTATRREAADDATLRRMMVAWAVPGFGPKSTSDWLNNRRVTTDLIAFDVRVCRILQSFAGPDFSQSRVARLPAYEAAEDRCRRHLAIPLDASLSEIDKRLFVVGEYVREGEAGQRGKGS